MSLFARLGGLRGSRPACTTGSTRRGRRVVVPAGVARPGSGWERAERTVPGSAVGLLHSPTGLALLGCVPAPPAGDRVRTANRDPRRGSETYRKGTCASFPDSGLVGVASATKRRPPQILAGILPLFLPHKQTERPPRCPFAPRRSRRVPRPRRTSHSTEANASNAVGLGPFWP